MTFFNNKPRICDGCICHILEDPNIFIDKHIFHNNICNLHYKYIGSNSDEKKLYEETGRNYFIDIVEYNIFKYKIRNPTVIYLSKYINNFFFILKND